MSTAPAEHAQRAPSQLGDVIFRDLALEVDDALRLIEECARLAGEASSQVDQRTRAALEPLPDLPGQLPLPTA